MLSILRNDWKRLLEEKAYLFVAIALTICSVGAAILLTNNIEVKGNIAVIGENVKSSLSNSPYFNITVLDERPKKSQLVQNQYDAVLNLKNDGSISVETIKSDDFKEEIYKLLENPESYIPNEDTARHIGTNIIGYMMMFLLIQGALYARLFAEDKEKHIIERIAMSPIAFRNYIFGHGLFMLLLVFLPSYSVVLVAKIFGIAVGFSLLQYAGLIGVLSLLATTFALFLNSFFCVADTANMLGSSLIVLTSILAGSFYSFSKNEALFNKILNILPQKDFINYVDALEKGHLSGKIELQLGYVLVLSVIFFLIAVFKTRKDYVYNK
ncbi:MAG: ABC transporter permease [Ruminiclostridium sp.]